MGRIYPRLSCSRRIEAHHHRHGAELRREIIRKLRSSRVPPQFHSWVANKDLGAAFWPIFCQIDPLSIPTSGKFVKTRAPGVHGDEDVERRLDRDQGPLKLHLFVFEVGTHGCLRAEEHQELLRNDGEHLLALQI